MSEARFIILNGRDLRIWAKNGDLRENNFLIEISRLGVVLQGEIPRLIEILGASKLAFGTGIPFNYADASLLKMQMLDSEDDAKMKCCGRMLYGYWILVSRGRNMPDKEKAIERIDVLKTRNKASRQKILC